MCGRYVLAMRASQARSYLEDMDMPVCDAPDDEGEDAPRQSYNFAPGNYGIVYRADVPDGGARPGQSQTAPPCSQTQGQIEDGTAVESNEEMATVSGETTAGDDTAAPAARYKIQSMKWGLIPSWTKRNPGYGSLMKTINCRSDSLSNPGGMWTSMKMRKRCVVVADGFYEWLKVGPKEKVPHYIKRKDGQPMLFAGLWDCVRYEDSDEKLYTYTVITVDSNPQLKFLHDRMPAILEPSSKELFTWIDPARTAWTRELQDVLRPTSVELEVYPVSKEVGKVGNNSPSFIIPVASKENKSNIANFFATADAKKAEKKAVPGAPPPVISKPDARRAKGGGGSGSGGDDEWEVIKKEELESTSPATKRMASPAGSAAEPPRKIPTSASPRKTGKLRATTSPRKTTKLSATSNGTKMPVRQGQEGSQKITNFFTKTT